MVSIADFVNKKFLVRLHFDLPSFLHWQGLMLDERKLEDANGGEVRTLAKRNAGKDQPICSSR